MKKRKRKEDNIVEYGTISLPIPLINSIKKKIKGTGINSVSAYVAFVLRQILSSSQKPKGLFSKEDEVEIKERLKSLGYL
ncbi:MAG: CopG family transcriptional regulator [Nanoarchaeota archaeon]|nr:CopG family transcriptional regulator [Nanoarchaeota archaeon]